MRWWTNKLVLSVSPEKNNDAVGLCAAYTVTGIMQCCLSSALPGFYFHFFLSSSLSEYWSTLSYPPVVNSPDSLVNSAVLFISYFRKTACGRREQGADLNWSLRCQDGCRWATVEGFCDDSASTLNTWSTIRDLWQLLCCACMLSTQKETTKCWWTFRDADNMNSCFNLYAMTSQWCHFYWAFGVKKK